MCVNDAGVICASSVPHNLAHRPALHLLAVQACAAAAAAAAVAAFFAKIFPRLVKRYHGNVCCSVSRLCAV